MPTMEEILASSNGIDIFGKNEKRAKNMYRSLARMFHPDMYVEASEKAQAEKVFKKLSELWESYLKPTPKHSAKKNTVKTAKREYHLGNKIDGDPFFTRFEGTYDDGHQKVNILITSNPGDTDLAENHISKVRQLQEEVPEEFRGFYPSIVEVFKHNDGSVNRVGAVQTFHEGLAPFSEILTRYPNGISGRDVAWMFRRMLVAVGNAHEIGIVHGAVNLDSLYVHPEKHGVVLSDWQYSVNKGQKLKAVPPKFKSEYPEKFLKGEPVSELLDIIGCAQAASALLADGEPTRMKNFFRACNSLSPRIDASRLLAEFDALLKGVYGTPKFHPFTLK